MSESLSLFLTHSLSPSLFHFVPLNIGNTFLSFLFLFFFSCHLLSSSPPFCSFLLSPLPPPLTSVTSPYLSLPCLLFSFKVSIFVSRSLLLSSFASSACLSYLFLHSSSFSYFFNLFFLLFLLFLLLCYNVDISLLSILLSSSPPIFSFITLLPLPLPHCLLLFLFPLLVLSHPLFRDLFHLLQFFSSILSLRNK